MKKTCCPHNPDVGLLLLRLGLAAVFIAAGWMKLSDMDATVGYFAQMGLSAAIAWAVALIEFLGGVAMLLGVYTCLAGGLLAVVMIGAIATVTGKMGFSAYQINLVLLFTSLGVASVGPGKYALCSMPMICKGMDKKDTEGGCCDKGVCKM